MRQQRETLEKELMSALPSAERQKLEQQQAERQQQMQEMASMTPEQRRERMEQMMRANGGINQMLRQHVLNSSPEARAEMTRREKEMRQRGVRIGG
jgi:DNA-directed RNA polymerase subunit F